MALVDMLIQNLETAGRGRKMTYDVIIPAVEGLRGKHTIRRYFSAYEALVKEDVSRDLASSADTHATRAIRNGASIEEVANSLAHDQFSYLLNKFGGKRSAPIHEAWGRAIPSLYPNGRLLNMLGF